MLHQAEITVVMHRHDRLKVGEVAIRWLGDPEHGFLHISGRSVCSSDGL